MTENDTDRFTAIPTFVNGIKFKSRLEARFYQWIKRNSNPSLTKIIHEPFRLGRNQYLPDFGIASRKTEDGVFVEVKPIAFAHEALLAIDTARETGINLMVVDDFGRDDWVCYGSVSLGDIDFFSTLKEHAMEVGIPDNSGRLMFFYGTSGRF